MEVIYTPSAAVQQAVIAQPLPATLASPGPRPRPVTVVAAGVPKLSVQPSVPEVKVPSVVPNSRAAGMTPRHRDITYRAPELHSEARTDPTYEDLPLSHRARKQIYMSSGIFEDGGPRGEAIYTPSRQNVVYGNLRQSLDQVREQPEFQLPSPADFRATVNAGHGVVSPGTGAASASVDVVSFGGGPDVPVVRAERDGRSMPREFWATSSGLQWHDTRAEYCGVRRTKDPSEKPTDSADLRKRRELSSEVLGNARRMQKSTSSPSHDIWSQSQKQFNSYDSRLGPRAAPVPEDSAVSDVAEAAKDIVTTDGAVAEPTTSNSARERQYRNLTLSSGNQFSKCTETRGKAAASESPGARRRRGQQEFDESNRERRKSERNYSDLFGNQAASPRLKQRREELHSTSNCSFLDHSIEIANRNVNGWRPIAPTTPREATKSEVLPGPSSEHLEIREGQEAKAVRKEERACWDTTSIMDSTAEIARRSRETRSSSAGRRDVEVDSLASAPRATSASERKRLDLSSGQFRKSNGFDPKVWDDGRKGPGPVQTSMPSPIARSNPSSPLGAPWRNVPDASAKQRRIMSLMSSFNF